MMETEVTDGCKDCSVLQNEIEKKVTEMEQQMAGFLTIKQKIVATDKLIREYQSSKIECDMLTRKNEEFSRLIDQLHRDLRTRNHEYSELYGELDPIKKANAECQEQMKALKEEADKWKYQVEAGKNFTAQLVEKVKVLEKYEEEVKDRTSKSKDCEKLETKMETLKEQYKDAKETATKLRRELNQLQKANKQLVRYAKMWGKYVETNGKFTVLQKKFFVKLCNNCVADSDADDDADTEPIETDMQSKLLEQLLGDESNSEVAQPELTPSEPETPTKCLSEKNKRTPDLETVSTTPSRHATKKTSQVLETISPRKTKTPVKNPTSTPGGTNRRTRKASENSVTAHVSDYSSDTDVTTGSEKECGIRLGPHTRSRSFKTPPSTRKRNLSRQSVDSQVPGTPSKSRSRVTSESSSGIQKTDEIPNGGPVIVRTTSASVVPSRFDLSSSDSESDPDTTAIIGIQPLPDISEPDNQRELQPIEQTKQPKSPVKTTIADNSKAPTSTDMFGLFSDSSESLPASHSNSQVEMKSFQSPPTSFTGLFDKPTSSRNGDDSRKEPNKPQSVSSIFSTDVNASDTVLPGVIKSSDSTIRDEASTTNESSMDVTGLDAKETPAENMADVISHHDVDTVSSNLQIEPEHVGVKENNEEPTPIPLPTGIEENENTSKEISRKEIDQKAGESVIDCTKRVHPSTEGDSNEDKKCEGVSLVEDIETSNQTQHVDCSKEKLTEGSQSSCGTEEDIAVSVTKQTLTVPSIENSKEGSSYSTKVATSEEKTEKDDAPTPDRSRTSRNEKDDGRAEKPTVESPLSMEQEGDRGIQVVVSEVLKDTVSDGIVDKEKEVRDTMVPNEASHKKYEELLVNSVKESDAGDILPADESPKDTDECLSKKSIEGNQVLLPSPANQSVCVSSEIESENASLVKEKASDMEGKSSEEPENSSKPESSSEPIDKDACSKAQDKSIKVVETVNGEVIKPCTAQIVESSEGKPCSEIKATDAQSISSCDESPAPVLEAVAKPVDPGHQSVKLPDKGDVNIMEPIKKIAVINPQSPNRPELGKVCKPDEILISKNSKDHVSSEHFPNVIDPLTTVDLLTSHHDPLTKRGPQQDLLGPALQRASESAPSQTFSASSKKKLTFIKATSPVPSTPIVAAQDSAFKVPRIPSSKDLVQAYPWGKGVKRSTSDDEVATILKQIRTNIIELPATLSPLPKSPELKAAPSSLFPIKTEEPKCRFPVLPRCAFNWTAKKLPISDKLTEQFGAYLHPGVQARVRFRRVSRRLRDLRSPDIVSRRLQSVDNFAEAERRPKSAIFKPPLSPLEEEADSSKSETGVPVLKKTNDEKRPRLDGLSTVSLSNPVVAPPQVSKSLPQNGIANHRIPQTVSNQEAAAPQNLKSLPQKGHSNHPMPQTDESRVQRPTTSKISKSVSETSSHQSKVEGLFGSDSSSESSDSDTEHRPSSQPLAAASSDRPKRRSPRSNLARVEEIEESNSGSPIVNPCRSKLLSQPQSFVPLGRANRTDSTPVKPTPIKSMEARKDNELGSSHRLGNTRVVKHLISPCSEALLSAVSKSKSATRVVAPLKRVVKEPEIPKTPALATVASPLPTSDLTSPLEAMETDTPVYKKRVSRTLKRTLELDSGSVDVPSPSPSKHARLFLESLPIPPIKSTTPVDTIETNTVPTDKRKALSARVDEIIPLGQKCIQTAEPAANDHTGSAPAIRLKSPEYLYGDRLKPQEETAVIDRSFSSSSSSEEDPTENEHASNISKPILSRNQPTDRLETKLSTKNIRSPSPEIEYSPRSPGVENTPRSPEVEDTSRSPEIDDTPRSPEVDDSPQSPDMNNPVTDGGFNEPTVINSSPQPCKEPDSVVHESASDSIQEPSISAYELIFKQLDIKKPPSKPPSKKLKKEMNGIVNRFCKVEEELTAERLEQVVTRVMRPDSRTNLSIFTRKMMSFVIRCCEDPMDVSMTPPAPPMTAVHQRCVLLLKRLDEENYKIEIAFPNFYSDHVLSEISYVMFQPHSTLTLEEMCSLARFYVAVCRSRGSLGRARTFLYDCLYFLPPRSYALTFTIASVWAEVLRQMTFPLGLTCVDQSIAYLLLFCCKVKAVPGAAGKVLQLRALLQSTYGYKNLTTSTVDDLVNYLMGRFNETNSVDEASSLGWSLALLARWEGVEFAISVIEKQLWPFLQRWSAGQGTNTGAAAVIIAIGMLGKTVPDNKRSGVKSVLGAMKTILQSEEVPLMIQEAAIEAVILLGESEDPQSVVQVLNTWKPVNSCITPHLKQVLEAFVKRHGNPAIL